MKPAVARHSRPFQADSNAHALCDQLSLEFCMTVLCCACFAYVIVCLI